MKLYIRYTGNFILMTCWFILVNGRGHVEVRLQAYINSRSTTDKGVCCKDPTASTGCALCDPYIEVFLENGSNPGVNISRIVTTDVYRSTNNIKFNVSSGHFDNPFNLTFSAFKSTMVLAFRVLDKGSGSTSTTSNQVETVRFKAGQGEPAGFTSSPLFVPKEANGSAISIQFEYRLQCDVHYYGESCATFCSPKQGQYKCSPSAVKICQSGWSGTECDIMEQTNPCYNNTCQHNTTCVSQPNKTYACRCGTSFTGKQCETMLSTTPTTVLLTIPSTASQINDTHGMQSNSTASKERSFLDGVTKDTLFIAVCSSVVLLLLLMVPLAVILCRLYKKMKIEDVGNSQASDRSARTQYRQ